MNKTEMKKEFKARFNQLFKNKRLLAIQLDGFTHRVIFNSGRGSRIYALSYSAYTEIDPEFNDKLKELFSGYSHYAFKHNATELIYIKPENA